MRRRRSAFMQEWFKEHADRNCSPKTVERYHELAAYILPHIGHVRLQDLTALALERVFNRLKDSGGRDRKTKAARPLSAKTVRHIASLVHAAMDAAIRWKLIKSNPVDGVVLPKVHKREAPSLDHEQLERFTKAAKENHIYEFVLLDAATGCRRGELLALTWTDVDFNLRLIRVSKSLEQTKAGLRVKSTKTEETREIPLPVIAIEVLRSLRVVQAENRRLLAGDYRDDLNLVFSTVEGDHLKPDSLTAKICLVAAKAGMRGISQKALRHAYGSFLLSEGMPLTAVSKLLGHSDIYTTAKIYSHSLSKDTERAGDMFDATAKKAKLS